ncbi:hypothetical protein K7432_015290 [Basidiobolus ranarum]|uniref:Uncharacterized protein n=1 Tax=Basidiobolus ranarum TaxID=34480 RepID=A0ABR2WGD0_9FUNG
MEVHELRQCAGCVEKFFNRHYDIINATWSRQGLKNIPGSVACDDHFDWHRLNCDKPQNVFSKRIVDLDDLCESTEYVNEYLF